MSARNYTRNHGIEAGPAVAFSRSGARCSPAVAVQFKSDVEAGFGLARGDEMPRH